MGICSLSIPGEPRDGVLRVSNTDTAGREKIEPKPCHNLAVVMQLQAGHLHPSS